MPTTKTRQPKQPREARGVAQRELDASINAAGNALQGSERLTAQRRQLQAAFGPAVQLRDDGAGGPFASQVQAGADPQSFGLTAAQPAAEGVETGAVYQLANWKALGAKKPSKGSTIWVFKDKDKAQAALTTELGESLAGYLEDGDWELGLKYALDREEGADAALKLLHSLAAENLRKARIAERRKLVTDTKLIAQIDASDFCDIAKRALKLGVSLFIEGNLNGGIGNGWELGEVNNAIRELDERDTEVIEIADKEDDDERLGIVIRDAHKASNKTEQGKGSIYRGVDVQANVNMYVLGKLVQVHLNVG